MSFSPAISAVLSVYNGEAYLREAVESILAQTFADFELIAINDGSTDGSGAILRELAAHDARIVLIERPNGGISSALNEGIQRARAPLIARLDADDVALPERFALQLARMKAEPALGVLGSFVRIMNKTGCTIRIADYPVTPTETARFLEHGCPVAHSAVMMRKDVVIKAGGYRAAFAHGEDYDLWVRVGELGYAIANLRQILVNYRLHGANVSILQQEAMVLGGIVVRLSHRCRKAGLPDPVDGIEKLHPSIIDSVPAYLRQDLDAMIFVLRHSNVSLASRVAVYAAWLDYQKLEHLAKQDSVTCGFLMRLFYGAVCNRAYGLALRALVESVRLHPFDTIRLLWRKLKARILNP